MAAAFPYTHYACPCSDLTADPADSADNTTETSTRPSTSTETSLQIDQDRTFDPHDPRANYALYPLDQLLYCDECDAVRCPRCWTEEVLYWYCPSCLFEVPSSGVRGDGNRCSRSCYNCPSCTSPLSIVALPANDDGFLKPGGDTSGTRGNETYIMQCQYCEWNSLDIDVQFNKATKITEQLTKLRKARISGKGEQSLEKDAEEKEDKQTTNLSLDHDTRFGNLMSFYKSQLNESTDPQNPFSNSPYSSPANLARIMSLYGGLSYSALKKTRDKLQPMREAMGRGEGLTAYAVKQANGSDEGQNEDEDKDDEQSIIHSMQTKGWDGLANNSQRLSAPTNHDSRFTSQLWPTATPLRTRRGRRCNVCRQFLARPDPRVSSMRYRIRLLAVNFLPRLSMKPLHPSSSSGATSSTSVSSNPAFRLRPEASSSSPSDDPTNLRPGEAKQYILTLRNPIFETIHVTLGTPGKTPGKVSSRVTILCPSFDVGPAGDVWDEALSTTSSSTGTTKAGEGDRRAAMASLTGGGEGDRSQHHQQQPEAGKVWERTRNSTSVVVEIVPGSLKAARGLVSKIANGDGAEGKDERYDELEDDDVLEVPVYVRVEWEAEVKEGESSMGKKDAERRPGEKVKKELGYWVVLGVGKITA